MKYFLDLNGDSFTLMTVEEHDEITNGKLSNIGIEEDDADYTNKLDDYFQKNFGIAPDEWEIG